LDDHQERIKLEKAGLLNTMTSFRKPKIQ